MDFVVPEGKEKYFYLDENDMNQRIAEDGHNKEFVERLMDNMTTENRLEELDFGQLLEEKSESHEASKVGVFCFLNL